MGRRPGRAEFGDIRHLGLLSVAVFNDALEQVDEFADWVVENSGDAIYLEIFDCGKVERIQL